MKELIFFLLNFLDFWFAPIIIATIVAVIIEQVIRRSGSASEQAIFTSMRIRKFLYQQAVLLNVLWFLCYFIFIFIMKPGAPADSMGDPNLLWRL
tara:strand:- start:10101 stop:10385 length:285 start_codon:yes stop_codon:yes gene_type:complete